MKKYAHSVEHTKLTAWQKKGYNSYTNQKSKCYNKNNPDYKYYGAKGIKVNYSRKDFILWWDKQKDKQSFKTPTCGRVDHDGDYDFANIEIQDQSENSKERQKRVGAYKNEKPVVVFHNDEVFCFAKSVKDAAIVAGIGDASVSHICNGTYGTWNKNKKFISKTSEGFSFKYMKDTNWQTQ